MNEQHASLIRKFYSAFADHDAEGMIACYHKDVAFTDPCIGTLRGTEAGNMWRMLVERGGDDLIIIFSNVKADDRKGSAYWEAIYNFSSTNRKVHNKIMARFEFRDGLIEKHTDDFDFWKWSGMALGIPGLLLGWTGFFRSKFQSRAREMLTRYTQKAKQKR